MKSKTKDVKNKLECNKQTDGWVENEKKNKKNYERA